MAIQFWYISRRLRKNLIYVALASILSRKERKEYFQLGFMNERAIDGSFE